MSSCLSNVAVILNHKASPEILRTDESKENNVGVDTAHENTHYKPVLVTSNLALWRQGEARTDRCLDGGRSRRNQVAELVGCADDEGPERSRTELHQVDGDHTPGSLDAELFEERSCDDGFRGDEAVGVQEGGSDNADDDDGEPAPEDLRAIADDRPSGHGAEVCDDLRYGDGVGAEVELVRQQGWVEILGAVGLVLLARRKRGAAGGNLTMKLNPAIKSTK